MPRIIPYRITIKYIITASLSRGSWITMYNTYNIIPCGVIRSDVYYLFRPFAEICGFGGNSFYICAPGNIILKSTQNMFRLPLCFNYFQSSTLVTTINSIIVAASITKRLDASIKLNKIATFCTYYLLLLQSLVINNYYILINQLCSVMQE